MWLHLAHIVEGNIYIILKKYWAKPDVEMGRLHSKFKIVHSVSAVQFDEISCLSFKA